MRVGIVGFAGSGKTSLFELLTGVEPDHTAGLKGQLGMARVRDPRLALLNELYHPKKCTEATIELVDTPGLLPDNPHDNPHRLAVLRESDGLVVVLEAYTGQAPQALWERFAAELLLADLEITSGRRDRVTQSLGKGRGSKEQREQEHEELAVLEQVCQALESSQPVSGLALDAAQRKLLRSFQLLTEKPVLAVVNVGEDQITRPAPADLPVPCAALCAQLELELSKLDEADRTVFMGEMGLVSLSREGVIGRMEQAMGQICFFTANENEVRAWMVPEGTDALGAAGKVHTDMARGFIRAEVIHFADLERCGTPKEAKAQGLYRLEGRDHTVQDGDVVFFRFSV